MRTSIVLPSRHSAARAFALLLASFVPLAAETAVQHLLESKMYARLKAVDDRLGGVLGVAVIDLSSGRVILYNGEAVFPTASSIKIPILVQLFRDKVDFERKITLQPSDAVGGSGLIQAELAKGPLTLTVRELVTAMIEHSDNTATNQCIRMAGMDRVNQMLDGFGFRQTRLRRIMMDTPAARRGDENVSTPAEMAHLVELLYRGQLAGPSETARMIDILKLVKADFRRTIPASVEVASKPGDLPGVHCESGIVFLPGRPFVLSVFSTFLDGDTNPLPEVIRPVFDYFSKLAESNAYGNRTGTAR